jgi:hypothetical protein
MRPTTSASEHKEIVDGMTSGTHRSGRTRRRALLRLTGAGLPAIVVAAGLALTITQDTQDTQDPQDPQAGAPAAAARVATPTATPATAAGPATAKATPATAAGTWSADADGDRIDDRLAARLRTTPAHTAVEVVVRLTSGDADSAIATLRRTLGTFPVTPALPRRSRVRRRPHPGPGPRAGQGRQRRPRRGRRGRARHHGVGPP